MVSPTNERRDRQPYEVEDGGESLELEVRRRKSCDEHSPTLTRLLSSSYIQSEEQEKQRRTLCRMTPKSAAQRYLSTRGGSYDVSANLAVGARGGAYAEIQSRSSPLRM